MPSTVNQKSTNNYFKIPSKRLYYGTPKLVEDAEEEDVNLDVVKRRIGRILANPPLPIDANSLFFFDDTDPTSALRAYDEAKRRSSEVVVFKAVPIDGPWSAAPIVGFTTARVN